jgi:hypothetical protein
MRFFAHFAARGRDRIGTWRKRTRERTELIGGERDREVIYQVDELPSGDPALRLARLDQ